MADIVAHCQKQESTQVNSKKKQKCVDKTNNCKKAKSCVEKNVKVSVSKKTNKSVAKASNMSPQPGPSVLQKIIISDDDFFGDSIDGDDESLCCVCNTRFPEALRQYVSLVFAMWGKCMYSNCDHWTHLKFCCDVNVLRRHRIFDCPCHGIPCLQYEE